MKRLGGFLFGICILAAYRLRVNGITQERVSTGARKAAQAAIPKSDGVASAVQEDPPRTLQPSGWVPHRAADSGKHWIQAGWADLELRGERWADSSKNSYYLKPLGQCRKTTG